MNKLFFFVFFAFDATISLLFYIFIYFSNSYGVTNNDCDDNCIEKTVSEHNLCCKQVLNAIHQIKPTIKTNQKLRKKHKIYY